MLLSVRIRDYSCFFSARMTSGDPGLLPFSYGDEGDYGLFLDILKDKQLCKEYSFYEYTCTVHSTGEIIFDNIFQLCFASQILDCEKISKNILKGRFF
jgi:hypothetical protein